ncbi:MAG: sigma-70 family RNA polymerase sigma factor [Chitinophagales bacterium]
MSETPSVAEAIDHLFRHEYGKITAVLTRIFGTHNLELAEDIVQDTLLKALEQWRFSGMPENPSAWFYKVAKNKAIDVIRREKRKRKFAEDVTPLLQSEYTLVPTIKELFTENQIQDDVLRMMFACCQPDLPSEAQVALILKTLCGFSIEEIAKAFLTNQETINKRLYRARQQFREGAVKFEIPQQHQLETRLENVLTALYLLFNEGYNSTNNDQLVRKDLVVEATRLCFLLTQNEITNTPKVSALLSLMLFHASRLSARLDDQNNILLLADQDRTLWDRQLIERGVYYFERSLNEEQYSFYQLQAGIALQHAIAPSFEATDWPMILSLYNLICSLFPSPVAFLNRAIALAQVEGPARGIEEILQLPGKEKLSGYYLLPATLGELYLREEKKTIAAKYFNEALLLTQSPAEKKLLVSKLDKCSI